MIPTWLIVILSIVGFIGLILLIHKLTSKRREERKELEHQRFLNKISKWEVGDELVVYCYKRGHVYEKFSHIYYTAEKNLNDPRKWSLGSVKLIKWSEDEIIYECENGEQFYGDHNNIEYNRSARNRYRQGKMDNFMDSINDPAKFREERLGQLLDKQKDKEEEEE